MAVVESFHFNCKVNYVYESKFTMTCMNGLYNETTLYFSAALLPLKMHYY